MTCMTIVSTILLVAMTTLHSAWSARCNPLCARTRQLIVCRVEEKDYIWSVVDGVCRVFQNSCFFAAENCRRLTRCQCAMKSTSPENCKQSCPAFCPEIYAPVCATFPNTNTSIANGYQVQEFANLCFLDRYSCQNDVAYIGEPMNNQCQWTTQ